MEGEHACLFRQFAQTFLSFVVKQGAAAYKAVITVVKQHLFLGSKLPVVQVYGLNALEQALVQPDIVGVFCQYWLYLLGQRVHLVVGFCAKKVEKHCRYTRQQVVIPVLVVVNVDYGVVECRLFRVVDGFFYLLVVTAYSFHEGFFKVFKTDFLERDGVVWSVVWLKKRVLTLLCCNTFIHTDVSLCF